MKGVILGINPHAQIVDLSHEVPAHSIHAAAYLLRSAARYFPPGTIHVAVVDPGVGSGRRPLLACTAEQYFIAPDNGILSQILALETEVEIRELTAKQYFLGTIGSTFHGRDIFAPAAAWLSRGEPIESFGPRIESVVQFDVPKASLDADRLIGEVQHIDRFGNLITNIGLEDLRSFAFPEDCRTVCVRLTHTEINGLERCYADAPSGKLAALLNSDGLLELFCNQGRAEGLAKAGIGARVEIFRESNRSP
jgi:S-adenosylmethionine hydrolase